MSPPRPLDGYRVLDFTQNVAGPLAGQVLADLGAEVLKIEPPVGEASRRITSTRPGQEALAPYFLPNNRGKKSVVIDLRTTEGAAQVLALAATADVLLEGFRPGTMHAWGLGPDAVRAVNQRCVYASLTAYGTGAPSAQRARPGIDMLVQAESGLTTGLRGADGEPLLIASQIVDSASGHVLAQAVLAALLNRERHGHGDVVEVAMYDVACSLQANHLTQHLNTIDTDRPAPSTAVRKRQPTVATAPSGVFRASDDHLVIAAYIPKHWQLLTDILGRPDLHADPRFVDQLQRSRNVEDLTTELNAALAARTADEWAAALQDAGIMACKVLRWSAVVRSDVFAANGLGMTVERGERVETTVRTPARYASFPPAAQALTPTLGEHTDEVLGRTM